MKTYINLLPDGCSYMVAERYPNAGELVINSNGALSVYSKTALDKEGSNKPVIASDNKDLSDKGILWLEPPNGIDAEEMAKVHVESIYDENVPSNIQGVWTNKQMQGEYYTYINAANAIFELTKDKMFTLEQVKGLINQIDEYVVNFKEFPKEKWIDKAISSLTKTIECEVDTDELHLMPEAGGHIIHYPSYRKFIAGKVNKKLDCIKYKISKTTN